MTSMPSEIAEEQSELTEGIISDAFSQLHLMPPTETAPNEMEASSSTEGHPSSAPLNQILGNGDGDDGTDSEDSPPPQKKRGGQGRKKIDIEYIGDKLRRHTAFSKRKAGISKKAFELSRLTRSQVLLVIVSERGQAYSFATPRLQPLIVNEESVTRLEKCIDSPEPNYRPRD